MVGARIPELESCFFCCTLRTGSLIIAAVSMIVCGICASLIIPIIYATLGRIPTHDAYGFFPKFILLCLIMIFVVCAVLEVFSVFLWIGIKQYKETYILSWAIAVTAINIMQMFVFLFTYLFSNMPLDLTRDLLFLLVSCAFSYIALVVYSFYREIRRLKNTPQSFTNEA